MCDNMDIQEEGPPAHIKPIHKKTSFTISFRSRMKSLKQAASCWGKKIRGTSLPRNAYCHFENDFWTAMTNPAQVVASVIDSESGIHQ